ncbi:MAG: four helix bundle protein [Bacteroidota bacterium]
MHNFRKLKVWQKAVKLVKPVYKLASKLPVEENYALTSQIKRACSSISANIAEGAGRNTDKDFAKFLSIAQGSCFELESHLIVADTLEFISEDDLKAMEINIIEIEKMLNTMITKFS